MEREKEREEKDRGGGGGGGGGEFTDIHTTWSICMNTDDLVMQVARASVDMLLT